MKRKHPLKELVDKHKNGIPCGIYSACSANEYVIEAVMHRALEDNQYALIEATANQVNQFGGYTGMNPADFKNFVYTIAGKVGFPLDKVLLGGDHLGPLTWQEEPAGAAMSKALELIRQYVLAGFTKIHIDTSMRLGDDRKDLPLDTGVIAARGAVLAKEAEDSFTVRAAAGPAAIRPVYIVGSEVPVPGGSREEEAGIQVTRAADFENTVAAFKQAFLEHGLANAWNNVIAVVVQPGVEFGDETIHEYNRDAARELSQALKKYPGLVFEGHSTDYQTPRALKEMVEDGIAILKVGPALTFAMREGLFALSYMETELFRFSPEVELSNFMEVLDGVMGQNPANWLKHYHGKPARIRYARKYSFSDRCRYYLPVSAVQTAIDRLMKNLGSVEIPLTLINQFMPVQYQKIRNGLLRNAPGELLKDRIINCIDDYLFATTANTGQKAI
ncbi:aldolase-type tim barrel [Lucifera butyrica]|uniref:Aldolase-type tim barrel n=1 Tax=Lucifera butyrica TaxID=1351585 RepID=A0A498RGE3_9FIRM|nr:class II D-tagatose-bisphosphate aldolase, non-catalytic subunit [Lucifera butyrica]VBB08178.1 aldolase-type tim barrel [Lucifera butyrica]